MEEKKSLVFFLTPSSLRRLGSNGFTSLGGELGSASLAALESTQATQGNSSRVFSFIGIFGGFVAGSLGDDGVSDLVQVFFRFRLFVHTLSIA